MCVGSRVGLPPPAHMAAMARCVWHAQRLIIWGYKLTATHEIYRHRCDRHWRWRQRLHTFIRLIINHACACARFVCSRALVVPQKCGPRFRLVRSRLIINPFGCGKYRRKTSSPRRRRRLCTISILYCVCMLGSAGERRARNRARAMSRSILGN